MTLDEAFIPDLLAELDPRFELDLVAAVSEAETAVQELNARARPALAPLARLLLRTESVASSKVEDLQLGVRDLARAEAKLEAGGGVGATAREILANIDAMQRAIDEAVDGRRFGRRELESVHARLMEGSLTPHIAGRVRDEQNWIGGNDDTPCGADFVPPPPELVPELLDDLFEAVNDDALPPLVQAAFVHAQFETIHPFDDGNGRTGRALIDVVLSRRGLAPEYVPPISVRLARGKARYDVLPAHPIITAPVAAAATGRAKPRVYQAIESLEQAGVLVPVTNQRRNRSWEAEGLLTLLEGLEAGDMPPP